MSTPRTYEDFERDPFASGMWPGAPIMRRVVRVLLYLVLAALLVLFLLPFAWMANTSIKPLEEALAVPPSLLPERPTLSAYYELHTNPAYAIFLRAARNTLLLSVLVIVGTLLSSSLVAYGFARLNWPGRDAFFAATIATMMIPTPVLLLPLYSMFLDLGWIGSFKPLWVPAFFGTAANIFLLRQFFLSIPPELNEAARIDGAGELRIFWQIILPNTQPALLVVGLFAFLSVWNDFLSPLIFLADQRMFTLSLVLAEFHARMGGTGINLLMAAATLVVLPVFLLFFIFQKAFLRGFSVRGLGM